VPELAQEHDVLAVEKRHDRRGAGMLEQRERRARARRQHHGVEPERADVAFPDHSPLDELRARVVLAHARAG
jgi:hypothetical protein